LESTSAVMVPVRMSWDFQGHFQRTALSKKIKKKVHRKFEVRHGSHDKGCNCTLSIIPLLYQQVRDVCTIRYTGNIHRHEIWITL
jgi:hypothetical protein